MARAATTADAFNAVAEPRRRQILDVLAGGERPVNDLVGELGIAQPQVSKHLRVLREVGAVDVRDDGRRRLYRLNGHALKPIHDWVKDYERLWSDRFDELDAVLETLPAPAWFGTGMKIGYIFAVRLTETVLGNVFIWSNSMFYSVYRHAPEWGITPTHDLNLGGVVMMAEGSIVTLGALVWLFLRMAAEGELRQTLLEQGLDPRQVHRAVRYGRAHDLG